MSEMDTHRKQANSLYKSGKFKEALELYEQYPDDLLTNSMLVNKSSCHAHLQQLELAEKTARLILVQQSDSVKV